MPLDEGVNRVTMRPLAGGSEPTHRQPGQSFEQFAASPVQSSSRNRVELSLRRSWIVRAAVARPASNDVSAYPSTIVEFVAVPKAGCMTKSKRG